MKNNPLLSDFNTYLNTIPFSKITPEHFKPAIEKYIAETRKEISEITQNPEKPDFKNTIEALEFSGMQLSLIQNILMNINSAETTDEWQKVTEEVLPVLQDFYNEISQNKALFKRIEQVKESVNRKDLTPEQQMLLDKTYKSFVRNGAHLNQQDQKTLKRIDQELTRLKLQFNKNILHETNAFELHITDEKQLSGLPDSEKQRAAQVARKKHKKGWIFTLHGPSFTGFMKYADNRDLRRKMLLAYGSRGYQDNAYNNSQIVLDIARLRKERANLLGYNTHADYVLEERMAETPQNVLDFLNQLHQAAFSKAKEDVNKLAQWAKKDGLASIERWDVAYYMNKLQKSELNLDEQELKAYFPLENVLEGVFTIAQKLYGLRFKETDKIDTYHPDVRTFEVYDEKDHFKAVFYADFHPRPGKRQGAWKTAYKGQWKKDGKDSRPHISIVTNFTQATGDQPALLNFNEVTTLFHEFGHALHGILAQTTYPSLSGTNVYWDFVELPSQIMENWAYEKEALDLFARHYQTGETIPQKFVDGIQKKLRFMEGYATNRQLSFGFLDMGWHYHFAPSQDKDIGQFEKTQMAKTKVLPESDKTNMSAGFSHIFPGGYAAGYYSYKWAEVLDADAFAYFKEKGIFNSEVAAKFKKILESGGTQHPMELYQQFRGRKPKIDALLQRAGLKV